MAEWPRVVIVAGHLKWGERNHDFGELVQGQASMMTPLCTTSTTRGSLSDAELHVGFKYTGRGVEAELRSGRWWTTVTY